MVFNIILSTISKGFVKDRNTVITPSRVNVSMYINVVQHSATYGEQYWQLFKWMGTLTQNGLHAKFDGF